MTRKSSVHTQKLEVLLRVSGEISNQHDWVLDWKATTDCPKSPVFAVFIGFHSTDNPIEAGLSFTVAWDKPGGFVGREALLAAKAKGAPIDRLVSVIVPDPTVDLFGNEPVTVDGQWVGYVRAAAFGHTLGGPVGLAMVSHEGGVSAEWLGQTEFRIRTPHADVPATLQIGAPYDPQRLRILAE